ncbi:arginine decarboxylase [Alteromonas sp. 345S023]|uniref:Arginine decarboxylase n=1 Tax=Alteromonas profundi TaxID=2696062 RepID=A0A7X5RLX0_9ALTE|nr:arginine decarboxylase [Alteromonas profundi]NDV92493.1 arginine decarboxylase [Alteromonas profundi]
MSQQPYRIEILNNCICVTLRGHWDMATNIHYLSSLANTLNSRKGSSFYLLVDMRTWVVPASAVSQRIKGHIHLDRRNQMSELWLQSGSADVEHIADKFSGEQHFTLHRISTVDLFLEKVEQVCGHDNKLTVAEWLERNTIDKQN